MLVPAEDGKSITPADLEAMTPKKRKELERVEAKLQDEVKAGLGRIRDRERDTHEKVQELNSRTALFAVEYLIKELKAKYGGLDQVITHLESVQQDIVTNIDQIRLRDTDSKGPSSQLSAPNFLQRYDVNVVVDNSTRDSAPVIVENHPSYHNLIGRIEHEVFMGASRTDFTMIRPGALHRANGGYLILPARDVLLSPYT